MSESEKPETLSENLQDTQITQPLSDTIKTPEDFYRIMTFGRSPPIDREHAFRYHIRELFREEQIRNGEVTREYAHQCKRILPHGMMMQAGVLLPTEMKR